MRAARRPGRAEARPLRGWSQDGCRSSSAAFKSVGPRASIFSAVPWSTWLVSWWLRVWGPVDPPPRGQAGRRLQRGVDTGRGEACHLAAPPAWPVTGPQNEVSAAGGQAGHLLRRRPRGCTRTPGPAPPAMLLTRASSAPSLSFLRVNRATAFPAWGHSEN